MTFHKAYQDFEAQHALQLRNFVPIYILILHSLYYVAVVILL